MLPSVLSHQVRRGIEDFLRTTFPIHTPHFDGVIERLLDTSSREIFQGPYVSIKLPFRPGAGVSAPARRYGALDDHRDRDRLWQDRMLPLSTVGLLLAETG